MSPATTLNDTETRADNPVKKPLHYWPGYGVDQTVIVLPVFDVAVTLGNVAPQSFCDKKCGSNLVADSPSW